MKYLILFLLIISLSLIIGGYIVDSKQYIGFGVLVMFFIVFPLFTYHRWKGKNMKDYMLTKENLDKMRENQRKNKI